jgi:hypothetical protein
VADQIKRVDDLDNSVEAAERIYFSVRGQDFQIDLTEEHAQQFDEALKKYVNAATKLESQPAIPITRGRRRLTGGSGRDDIAEIRKWAEANGYNVSPRGRIKKEVIEAYDAAHS